MHETFPFVYKRVHEVCRICIQTPVKFDRLHSMFTMSVASGIFQKLTSTAFRSGLRAIRPQAQQSSQRLLSRTSALTSAAKGPGLAAPANPSSLKFRARLPGTAKKKFGELSKPSKDARNVVGYATAASYDLVGLEQALVQQDVYQVFSLHQELSDLCLCARAKYNIESESSETEEEPLREIFFFADGSVIFWSVPELEREMVLRFLRQTDAIEIGPYDQDTVFEESELMSFSIKLKNGSSKSSTHLDPKGNINLLLGDDPERNYLEKFAFSNAMAASVKLGALESILDRVIDSIEFLSEDMKHGRPIVMTRTEVLKKTGELFALRHVLNLSSDLIDTPDFYWDRESLESMYMSTCAHLAIGKRTRITNEKINHCAELLDLVTNHLNDNHHVRLEWFIIILIMIEVVFEILHFVERFV